VRTHDVKRALRESRLDGEGLATRVGLALHVRDVAVLAAVPKAALSRLGVPDPRPHARQARKKLKGKEGIVLIHVANVLLFSAPPLVLRW